MTLAYPNERIGLTSTVGGPDRQKFVEVILGKGLPLTTSKFSNQAFDYAKQQSIILIKGVNE